MSIEDLARPAVRNLSAYVAARQEAGSVRLNANENAVTRTGLNRYPEVRPAGLSLKLADYFDVAPRNLLVTRGSTEALDLLIRSFCSEGRDDVVVTPPTFEMYRVYADIQGAGIVEVPLQADRDFELDVDALLSACTERCKIVCICTPNNPTGTVTTSDQIEAVLEGRGGKSIVIVDEAYIEFSEMRSVSGLIGKYENLVVLRTLSKALALAGVRCGVVMGNDGLISLLNGVLSPYALAQPTIDAVTLALQDERLGRSRSGIQTIIEERTRLAAAFEGLAAVERSWPSHANFILARFHDIQSVRAALTERNILTREFGDDARLKGCARVTVGTPAENDVLLSALSTLN